MNFFIKTEKKGSALLVVLGFLTFMIISAVSFSIYMRIERQASSNYRHSITARHLLESALYRAMDEVDADLRGDSAVNAAVKFPSHWEGRVFTSKSNTPEIEDARVLSLEALSFLPASLVNDARYYSKATPQQPTYGTKWRRMSMPIEGIVDIESNRARSSGNKSYVGRYAYICVNLSDMFNINGCTNVVRSTSNLVSVASLFSTPMMAESFLKQAGMDLQYGTLQDFYACMAVANKNFFGGPSDSPYVQFLKDGKNLSFNDSFNHLLVTDGFAKAPPARSAACNVTLYPPFAPGQLSGGVGGVGPSMDPVFAAKIREIFPDDATIAQDGWPFQAMLADYLSKDSVGVMRLDAPSSKLAPMICQVRLAAPITPNISSEIQGTPPNEAIVYSLNLVSDVNAMSAGLGLQVRVCFPFKNVEPRIKPYTLKVEGFIRVDKTAQRPELTSQIALDAANDTVFTGTATITPRAIDGVGDAPTVQNKCYQWVPVPVNIPVAPIKMADSKGAVFNNFNINSKINVALVITSMKIQIGSVIYDSTPETPPGPSLPDMPKLYFQTGQANIVAGNPGNPWMIPYVWDSLEVADPRFNHYVVNWVNNMDDPDRNNEGIHKLTKDLLGLEGRDADIFMASSGTEKLQSIGELGFIVRPYKYDPLKGMKQVDFRVKKLLEPANDDSDAFFRTIRLYDQAGKLRDKVYDNFYMALDAEGNLPLQSNVRVNPLTSVGPIIECALDRIPYNFNIASAGSIVPKQNFTEGTLKNGWAPFVEKWAYTFTNEVRIAGLNTSFQRSISDFYGDDARMGWYSAEKDARLTIFKGGFVAPAPVYEIDRKMMYAFSMDSMSDRQQLFLYVFQAESVAPISFAEMRSLAGGRAVAVVWRDPYPKGSKPDNPPGLAGSWYENSSSGGTKGYHEQKILFFKQLDN